MTEDGYSITYCPGGSVHVDVPGRKGRRLRAITTADAITFARELRTIHESELPTCGLSAETIQVNAYSLSNSVQQATGCSWPAAWEAVGEVMPELFAEHWAEENL